MERAVDDRPMIERRHLIAGMAAAPLVAVPAFAETEDEKRRRTDWPWLGRFADDNRRLLASRAPVGIVFLGDSITQGWGDKRPGFFRTGRINRGIGGQTTPQMLLRTMADVVALRPRALHLMAGTNDVAGNTGPMTPEQTEGNLTAICQLARANRIRVLLASIPPAASFPWRPGLATVAPIRALNAWAKRAAPGLGATWVDYWPALADPAGGMRDGFADDGVHPTVAGYDAMAGVIEPVLRRMGL